MEVWDIEAVVREYLWIRDCIRDLQARCIEKLFSGRITRVQELGESLRALHRRMLELFPRVQEGIRWAEEKSYTVDHANEFQTVAHDVETMSRELETRWPFIDPKQVERSRAAFAQGDFQSAGDILSELQNSDPRPG